MKTHIPYTLEQRERIVSMYVNMTAREIAKAEGRTLQSIKEVIRYDDVRKNSKYTEDDLEIINSDLSNLEVAKLIGRTRQEVNQKRWQIRKKAKLND